MSVNSGTRHRLLMIAKIILMMALLAWMIEQIEWRDYVVMNGRSCAVVDATPSLQSPQQLLLAEGPFWNRSFTWKPVDEHIEPIIGGEGRIIRPGLASSFQNLRLAILAAGVLLAAASLLAAAFRWRLLLTVQRIHLPKKELVRLAFLASFFDGILPGGMSGDLVKAYCVAKGRPEKSGVLASLVVDRFLGVCGFAMLAAAALAVVWLGALLPKQVLALPAISLAVIAAGLVAVGALMLSSRIRTLRVWNFLQRLPFGHYFTGFGDAAALYRHRPGIVLRAVALTFSAQGLFILSVILIGASLNVPAPWYLYVICVPLIVLIGALPLTPGGIGVAENLYIVFLASVGNPSLVLALALLVRFSWILTALPGAVIAIIGGVKPVAAAAAYQELLEPKAAENGPPAAQKLICPHRAEV